MTELKGKWKLEVAASKPISQNVEVFFLDDKIEYRYGNTTQLSYEVDGQNVKFGSPVGTEIHCPQDPPEETVSDAFQASTKWVIKGNTLTLSAPTGVKVILTKIS